MMQIGNGAITGLSVGGLPDGTVDTDTLGAAAVTAPKLDGAQSGVAPVFGCRAWVNFNGTGVVAIRGSGNVSSITDNAVGDYTINFTTAMPDVNFGVLALAGLGAQKDVAMDNSATRPRTVSSVSIITSLSGGASAADDSAWNSVAIFR